MEETKNSASESVILSSGYAAIKSKMNKRRPKKSIHPDHPYIELINSDGYIRESDHSDFKYQTLVYHAQSMTEENIIQSLSLRYPILMSGFES